MTDPYDLDRFVAAQAGSYETALGEIRRGAKRSHWMWYIFPQIAGLGRSDMAQRLQSGRWAKREPISRIPSLAPACGSAWLPSRT